MIFRYIISIFIIIAAHIATFAAWTDSGRKVLSECVNCSSLRQFPELLKKASELERIGRAGGNREEEIAGKSYRIRALIHLRDKSDLSNDIGLSTVSTTTIALSTSRTTGTVTTSRL